MNIPNSLHTNSKTLRTSNPRRKAVRGRTHFASARGFSLIELMVAMTIGVIITIAVVQIFSSSQNTYRVDQGLSRLQENGRYAMDLMAREIRMAGNLGCLQNVNPTIDINGSGTPPLNFTQGLKGYEYQNTGPGTTWFPSASPVNASTGWTPSLALDSSIFPIGATPGTDAIVVYHVDANPTPLLGQPQPQAAAIFLPGGTYAPPAVGQIAFLTDCQHADLFQITSVSTSASQVTITHAAAGSPGNSCVAWGTSNGCGTSPNMYQPGNTAMYTVTTSSFFVATDPNKPQDGPGLWEATFPLVNGSLTYTELVHGVDNLQILYGVDTDTATSASPDGTAEVYETADQVNNANLWSKVVSVRFSLLMRTSNITGSATDTTPDTAQYYLTGTTQPDATTVDQSKLHDDLRRRVFTATVSLRNRGP